MPLWTIVIAPNTRTAIAEMRFCAFKKYAPHELVESRGRLLNPKNGDLYEAVSAATANRDLEGTRPSEIIIVDYPHWHFLRPGMMTNLWAAILAKRAAHDTLVRWR